MKNFKILLALFALSILAIVVTGVVLNFIGIEHGPLIIKIGFIFIVVNVKRGSLLIILNILCNPDPY
jgi:hypothetical protein